MEETKTSWAGLGGVSDDARHGRSAALRKRVTQARHKRALKFQILPETSMSKKFQFSIAPEKLWQAINPWTFYQQGAQFGLVNIDLGQTSDPQMEQAILDKVGSYGRQLGHLGDVIEALLNHVDLAKFTAQERDAIAVVRGDLAKIRQVKAGT
jgi:hypothetical protein